MATRTTTKGEFTGRHMLVIMVAFFATIIGVNVTMAVFASKSWSGLVVKNSYVASQEFNEHVAEARAQAALGWEPRLQIGDGMLRYALTDSSRNPVRLDAVTASFKRPVSTDEDMTVEFVRGADGVFATEGRLADGVWVVEILSQAGLDHPYRDTRRIVIADGRLK